MNLISNTAVMLCICTVACILVKFLVPEGVTRKTLNLITRENWSMLMKGCIIIQR